MQAQVMLFVLRLAEGLPEDGPEPEDVKAGWLAFGIFLALVGAVVVLAFSLVKQLRKAQAAKDAGVYGDEPVETGADDNEAHPA